MHNKNEILLEKFNLVFTDYFGSDMALSFIDDLKNKSLAKENIDETDQDFCKQMVETRIIIDSTITYAKSKLVEDIYPAFILDLTTILAESCCINLAEEILINTISVARSDRTFALLLLLLADISIRKSFWDNSIKLLNQATEILSKVDDKLNLAKCENLFGTLYGEKGDIITAKNHFLKSTEYLVNNVDEKLSADIENNLAILENITGNLGAAREHYTKALRKFESLKQTKKIAETMHNLGMLYSAEGNYKSALQEFDKAINIAQKEDFKSVLSISFLGKANAHLNLRNYNETSVYCYKAMNSAIQIDDKLTIADVYRIIGILEREMKHYDTGEKYFLVSIRLNNELGNNLNYAESAFELGLLYSLTRSEQNKKDWLNKALTYYSKIKASDKVREIEALLN